MGGSNKKIFEGMIYIYIYIYIYKELVLDKSAWKMTIHVPEP
jgi:hypothetical protein